MKKLAVILMFQFFIVALFAQNGAQMSLAMENSNGIREIDRELQKYKTNNGLEDVADGDLITNFRQFSLSFVHNNQLYVLAYDDFDEDSPNLTRGVYLFRKDSTAWHVASKRIFTSTFIENKLIDELLINPSNTNTRIEVFDEDKIFMLVKNRVWVSDLETNQGRTIVYSMFILFTPKPDGSFRFYVFTPYESNNKFFDFFPETEPYEVTKRYNYILVSSGDRYVKFMFNGSMAWESSPYNLTYYNKLRYPNK